MRAVSAGRPPLNWRRSLPYDETAPVVEGERHGGLVAAEQIAAVARGAEAVTGSVLRPRPPRPIVDARTPTGDGTGISLRLAEDIIVSDVRGPDPVEHLVADSSEDYRAARRRTAAWLYAAR